MHLDGPRTRVAFIKWRLILTQSTRESSRFCNLNDQSWITAVIPLSKTHADAEHVEHSRFQVRQLMNTQAAMALAREDGMQWLLHIDSDELFLPAAPPAAQTAPAAQAASSAGRAGERRRTGSADPTMASAEALRGAARAHFDDLTRKGVETFLYHNHEVVPETVPPLERRRSADSKSQGDPFTEHTLFKRAG